MNSNEPAMARAATPMRAFMMRDMAERRFNSIY
jgi:hypothetical protein